MSGSIEIELLNRPASDLEPFSFKERDILKRARFRKKCKNLTQTFWGVEFCKMTSERCEESLDNCQLWQMWCDMHR